MHTITLRKEDQALLLECLAASQEIKSLKLKRPESIEQMEQSYLDAAYKFLEPITIHNPRKNLFTWFRDQMMHSGQLWETELCQRALLICDHAVNDSYHSFKQITHIKDLFRD